MSGFTWWANDAVRASRRTRAWRHQPPGGGAAAPQTRPPCKTGKDWRVSLGCTCGCWLVLLLAGTACHQGCGAASMGRPPHRVQERKATRAGCSSPVGPRIWSPEAGAHRETPCRIISWSACGSGHGSSAKSTSFGLAAPLLLAAARATMGLGDHPGGGGMTLLATTPTATSSPRTMRCRVAAARTASAEARKPASGDRVSQQWKLQRPRLRP